MIALSDVLFMGGHCSNCEHYPNSVTMYKLLWKMLRLESDVLPSPRYS